MKKMKIKVNDKVFDVEVEILEDTDVLHEVHHLPQVPEGTEPRRAMSEPMPMQPPTAGSGNTAADAKSIKSPLAGTVMSVLVNVGDTVAIKDCVCTLESMKMETKINTPVAGKIKKVNIAKGQSVQQNSVLFELE